VVPIVLDEMDNRVLMMMRFVPSFVDRHPILLSIVVCDDRVDWDDAVGVAPLPNSQAVDESS
jgi:hypothetical protein